MSEKGLLSGVEHLGHGLLELALGLGAIALGLRFFKESFKGGTKKKKEQAK